MRTMPVEQRYAVPMWEELPFPVPAPLPRGPHGLSRDEVRESQRLRLLVAAAQSFAAKGFAATTVADITKGSGVSRVTFYELFQDKTDCFLAAYKMAVDFLVTEMINSAGESEPVHGLAGLEELLTAYLSTLQSYPGLARMFLVEVYVAGPRAVQVRLEGMTSFVELIIAIYRGDDPQLDTMETDLRHMAEIVVAAVSSMATNFVAVGAVEDLSTIRESVLFVARRLLG